MLSHPALRQDRPGHQTAATAISLKHALGFQRPRGKLCEVQASPRSPPSLMLSCSRERDTDVTFQVKDVVEPAAKLLTFGQLGGSKE